MDKEAQLKLEIRKDEIYSEWKLFLNFWWEHPSLTLQECFTVYNMQVKNNG